MLITYRNGTIKTLKITKDPSIPLVPYFTRGTNTDHTKIMAAIGYSDQENVPDIAISQIEQTMMPSNSKTENDTANIFWRDTISDFADFSA